jgi:hypothetical protein
MWRSTIVAGYVAFAILIGVAYGLRGLAILLYFYFWAGAWVVFLLVWGQAARAAGRWNFERLNSAPVPGARNRSRPGEPEAHVAGGVHESPPALDAKRRRPRPVLQP